MKEGEGGTINIYQVEGGVGEGGRRGRAVKWAEKRGRRKNGP